MVVYRITTKLMREIAVHSKLKHQNIIVLLGVVFEPENYGALLEYAAHGDLWNFIHKFSPVCRLSLSKNEAFRIHRAALISIIFKISNRH